LHAVFALLSLLKSSAITSQTTFLPVISILHSVSFHWCKFFVGFWPLIPNSYTFQKVWIDLCMRRGYSCTSRSSLHSIFHCFCTSSCFIMTNDIYWLNCDWNWKINNQCIWNVDWGSWAFSSALPDLDTNQPSVIVMPLPPLAWLKI
jgi:hypothetical protein